ncbi:glycosyltransferase [Actinosynnema sp. NPDC050801]|uniref:glycosyltransferase n=1 Tax=unclassified Actinosynnema TaxID=2637065 RepID=UPI0033F0F5C1
MSRAAPADPIGKVLLVNGNYEDGTVGGTQVHTRLLAHALRDEGRTVAVLCQGDEDDVTTLDGIEVHRIKPPRLPSGTRSAVRHAVNQTLAIHNPFVRRRVHAAVRRFRPDLCHVHMLRRLTPAVLPVLRAHRLPVVQTVHELFSLWNFNAYLRDDRPEKIHSKRPWPVTALKEWHRRLSTTVHHVCAPSRFALDAYRRDGYFAGVPASVVPLSVPFEWGDPERIARRKAAESRDRPLRLLFVGRLDNYKGVRELLAAVHALRDLDLRLDVAGDGLLAPLVAGSAERDRRITFHGPVHGARRHDLYRRADVLLCPSTWTETFGYVVLEAYAAGLPVIASSVGALPDVVRHRRTGLLVRPGSVADLVAAIRAMTDRVTRCDLGGGAARWIRSFQSARPVDAQLAAYRAAVGRHAG